MLTELHKSSDESATESWKSLQRVDSEDGQSGVCRPVAFSGDWPRERNAACRGEPRDDAVPDIGVHCKICNAAAAHKICNAAAAHKICNAAAAHKICNAAVLRL